jgi:hypothetical protein
MGNNEALVRQVRDRVSKFLQRRDMRELTRFIRRIEAEGGRVALFGGTVRDLLLQMPPRYPRDIDLVIEAEDIRDFVPFLTRPVLRKTRFGGIRTYIPGYSVDVWTVSSTWGFKHSPYQRELRNLPLTTFLNAEAIAVELTSASNHGRQVYDAGFFEAIEERTLEINLAPNPYPELSAVRSLHLAERTGFKLGFRLSEFVRRILRDFVSEKLLAVQQQHYGRIVLDGSVLAEIRNQVLHTDGSITVTRRSPTQRALPFSNAMRTRISTSQAGSATVSRAVEEDCEPRGAPSQQLFPVRHLAQT